MSEVIKNREEIKKQLPKFYDYQWQFRDEGGYFDFQIPHSTSHNLEIQTEILIVAVQHYYNPTMI